MIEFALHVAQMTRGYFDPTIGGLLSSLGYGRTEQRNHIASYKNITLHGDFIELQGDVMLEFGGVGKGYLIDTIKTMIDSYITHDVRYIIDFGGDIYARGGYAIGLENPLDETEAIGTIQMNNTFLACSSGSKRRWGEHHHLIDPKTGQSAKEVIATFIEGRSGIITDSFATALCVMPFLEACELLFTNPDIEGVLLSHDGRFFRSPGSNIELFTS